jgi:hypothetical protein
MKQLELPWPRKEEVTTVGARSMIGKETTFVGRIRREIYKRTVIFT